MNKKFSTLLAAALVAGGLGSSAFAQTTPFPVNEYVQLKVGDQFLVVGESANRDSLALLNENYSDPGKTYSTEKPYELSIEDINKTLWKFTVKEVKDANGLHKGYDVYLENKVSGAVVLTKQDASDKSAYYAPGAVVTPGSLKLSGFEYDSEDKTVSSESGIIDFCGSAFYDAASKTIRKYTLGKVGDAIKLFVLSDDASSIKTSQDLEKAIKEFNVDFKIDGADELGDIEASAAADLRSYSLTANLLNGIGNDGFNLVFNADITSNAKYENPFSANTLSAVNANVYSSASYDTKAYDAAMKTYKEGQKEITEEEAASSGGELTAQEAFPAVEAGIDAQKAAAQAYVKELKVALASTVQGGGDFLDDPIQAVADPSKETGKAPNKVEIKTAANEFGVENFANPNDEDKACAYNAIKALKTYVDVEGEGKWVYDAETGKVEGADAKAAELDKRLAEVEKQLDAVKSQVSAAVANFDKAVQAYTSVAYRSSEDASEEIKAAYEDNKIKVGDANKNADEALDLAKALFDVDGKWADFVEALSSNIPSITKSESLNKVEDADTYEGYMPIAVVGEADTYVTVDTNYVASSEKYLALGTTKLNKVVIDADEKAVDADDAYNDNGELKSGYEEILVPELNKHAVPALFKMSINLLSTSADKITILGVAPYVKNTTPSGGTAMPKYYAWYDDNESSQWVAGRQVVIRTLGGVREASIMLAAGEAGDVKNNTTITFAQPVLASKINDGDIYFIINKNVAEKENYDKYVVVDPIGPKQITAKEAFLNVPATQWLVEKNNDIYTLKNRDYDRNYLAESKIFVVDEDNMIYTTTARDTFQLVAADAEKEGHLGYKYIAEEIQKISDFALSAINYANVETPFYLTFNGNEDSILTATSNKDEALALIPMINEKGEEVTEEYAMNDENLTKQYYQLIGEDGEDTLYLKIGSSNELIVTKVKPVIDLENDDPSKVDDERIFLQFRSINDEANQYEVLLIEYNQSIKKYEAANKLSYNQDGEAVAVAANTVSAFVYDLVDNSTDIYKNFGFEGSTKVIISLNGDAESKVTKIGPFATVKRTGLNETVDADYSLIMDTAYVDHKDNIRYAYYITKPIVAADTAWNAEKFYMISYADSVAAKRDNDTIKYAQDGLTRIGFVAAKRIGTDSLAITKAVGAAATDTLNVTEALGVTNATFAFAIDENNDEAYRIEIAPNTYVSYLNGILVEGKNKEQAQLFNVNATDLTPTENEEISVEDGVQVIGGKGAVTVQGAAGKTVTVYNFQGRALASTTLTSDNQTIAVPAGLVAVSVEGEPEAISVVVK